MTVINRIRAATADEHGGTHPELVAAGRGALTAAASWVLVLVVTTVAVASDGAPVGGSLGAGSALWLALGGARLGLGEATIALVPLLALAGLVVVARLGARRALRDMGGPGDPVGLRESLSSPFARAAGAWVGGYAALALLAWAVSAAGPFDVRALSVLLPALVVPALGVLLAEPALAAPLTERLPAGLRRGIAPGLRGAGVLLGVGSLVVIGLVLLHVGRVLHVHSELDAGAGGAVLLGGLQALSVPNLALWALSWLAGPGFSVSLGAETTWAESQTSLLPMIPVLAAHPDPGALPWVTRLVVLVPVAVGAWIAHDTLSRISRLSRTSDKLGAVAAAVVVGSLLLGLLDAVGGGSLGADRISDIGAPAVGLVTSLLVTLGVGAAAVVARDWWRLRR